MLAIGIVVDDAIVVVENVERNIALGLKPIAATAQAMEEVTSPIIATALVLCAVFVPTAFISGFSGQFYKQFAMTIAISTVISAINSLTLSPALCAVLLKDHDAPKDWLTRIVNACSAGSSVRSTAFSRVRRRLRSGVGRVLRKSAIALVVYGGLVGLTGSSFTSAHRLRADAGQTISRRIRAIARRRIARSHRSRHPPHVGHRAENTGVEAVSRFRG